MKLVSSNKQAALRDASIDLEALRPQALDVIGDNKPEDEPIRQAWTVALDRCRQACAEYVADASSTPEPLPQHEMTTKNGKLACGLCGMPLSEAQQKPCANRLARTT